MILVLMVICYVMPRAFTRLTPCVRAAERNASLPRVASLQNAYSLLCRTFDMALAEVCHTEAVSLLAYSPLAMGLLTVSSARTRLRSTMTAGLQYDS